MAFPIYFSEEVQAAGINSPQHILPPPWVPSQASGGNQAPEPNACSHALMLAPRATSTVMPDVTFPPSPGLGHRCPMLYYLPGALGNLQAGGGARCGRLQGAVLIKLTHGHWGMHQIHRKTPANKPRFAAKHLTQNSHVHCLALELCI